MQKRTVRNVVTLAAMTFLLVGILVGGCASPASRTRQKPVRQTTEPEPIRPAPSINVLERVLAEAKRKGWEIIHNARLVPCGPLGPGKMTMPAGTKYYRFGSDYILYGGSPIYYYKNKEDTLIVAATPEGRKYISGKGAVKYGNKLYCFGF